MLYETIYNNLIQKRVREIPAGYTETHHIIPKSFGGSNDKENLVSLTAREHYLAHYLLLKMQEKHTEKYFSALKAFLMMQCAVTENQFRYTSSLKFEYLRTVDSEYKSLSYIGEGNSQFGTMWICNPTTKVNSKIKRTETIPDGFLPGRNLFVKKNKIINSDTKTIFLKKEPYTFVCMMCGKSFWSPNKNRKLCSHDCSNKYMTGERVSKRLTEKQVVEIRKLLSEHKTLRFIGDMFGVSYVAISKIKNNHSWKI